MNQKVDEADAENRAVACMLERKEDFGEHTPRERQGLLIGFFALCARASAYEHRQEDPDCRDDEDDEDGANVNSEIVVVQRCETTAVLFGWTVRVTGVAACRAMRVVRVMRVMVVCFFGFCCGCFVRVRCTVPVTTIGEDQYCTSTGSLPEALRYSLSVQRTVDTSRRTRLDCQGCQCAVQDDGRSDERRRWLLSSLLLE